MKKHRKDYSTRRPEGTSTDKRIQVKIEDLNENGTGVAFYKKYKTYPQFYAISLFLL